MIGIDAHTEVGIGEDAKEMREFTLGKLTGGVQVGGCGLVVCEPDADGRISVLAPVAVRVGEWEG